MTAILDELRVADVVRRYAADRPDAVAIRHGEREVSYKQLDERSSRLAQVLLAAGADPGARVAHLDRSAPEIVELFVAAAKIGAVAVPLNWRLAVPELTAIVADAGSPLMIAAPAFAGIDAEVAAGVPQHVEVVGVGADYEARLASADAVDPGGSGEADDPVVQMYTSGTTGAPKGVLTTQRNLAAATLNVPAWRFDAESVSLTPLPMFHVGGIGWTYLGLSQGEMARRMGVAVSWLCRVEKGRVVVGPKAVRKLQSLRLDTRARLEHGLRDPSRIRVLDGGLAVGPLAEAVDLGNFAEGNLELCADLLERLALGAVGLGTVVKFLQLLANAFGGDALFDLAFDLIEGTLLARLDIANPQQRDRELTFHGERQLVLFERERGVGDFGVDHLGAGEQAEIDIGGRESELGGRFIEILGL